MIYRSLFLLGATLLAGLPLAAQLPSNATLKGSYYFRYLGVNATSTDVPLAGQGMLTFDGNGGFTVTAQGVTPGTSTLQTLTSGTYRLISSGIFKMTNPFDTTGNTSLFGNLGVGAIVASSTDTYYLDMFIAIPVSTAASNATLTGSYNVASMDFANGTFTNGAAANTRNTFFTMTADGKGGLGTVSISGTSQSLNSAATTQTSAGATYTVNANGSGTVNFPAPSGVTAANVLLAGNKTLYVSSDGNLFIGGGASGYDFIIGVKSFSGSSPQNSLSGLYVTNLLNNYAAPNDSSDGIYASDGSANEIPNASGGPVEISHQRNSYDGDISSGSGSYDFTQALDFTLNSNGTVTYSGFGSYALSANGTYVLGGGDGTNYQLNFYAKALPMNGSGVFLDPQGVVNAASNVPFTAQVAPGEVVTLYGSGMATQTATAQSLPFPTTLGNVQVTMSFTPSGSSTATTESMPLYYVSPTQISGVVPYDVPTDGSFLTFQVSNNGTKSNSTKSYTGQTSPGVFTVPPGGIGDGAILDSKFNLVSSSNPGKVGDTVQIFLTGLGTVTPTVAAGAAAPSNPLSKADNMPDVYIDGIQANVTYAGLAPQLGGLYQINVTIPSGVTTNNDDSLEISTVDADNIQANIPIGQ